MTFSKHTLEDSMRNVLSNLVVIGLILFFPSFSARAQESPRDLFKLNIEEFLNVDVVSVSKKQEKQFTAPGTIYVITEEMINRYGFRSLQETLKYVPSIYLYDPHSWVWGGQRGFVSNFSQTLLLLNGREVNNLIAGEGFISRQFGTQNIKRIEVLASPGSALYGANALAGVINVITKDAAPTFEGIEMSLESGSNNTTVASVVFGKSFRNISLKGSIRHYESDEEDFLGFVTGPNYSTGWVDSDRANPYITEYNNESEATTISLQLDFKGFYGGIYYYDNKQSHGLEKLRWDYTDGEDSRKFTLFYAGFEDDVTDTTRLKSEIQYIRSYLYGSYDSGLWPVARLQVADSVSIFTLPNTVTTGTGQALNGEAEIKDFYASYAEFLIDQGIIDPDNISPEEIETYFQHVYSNKNSDSNQRLRFDLLTSQELGDVSSLDVGYSFDYIDMAGLAVTDAAIGIGATVDVPFDELKAQDVYESFKHGIYGQFQHILVKDKLWMTLGLRYDHQEHYGSNLSPRAGLVWQPNQNDTIKLLYGEAFREPNIFELSSDPDLDPAVLKSIEICAAHSFGDIARISLSGYHSKIDDFLGSVSSLIGTGVGQVKKQTVQGLEWQVDIRKGPVNAFLNGAWVINAKQDVRDSGTGVRYTLDLLGLPERKISIGASYQFFKHMFLSLICSHIEPYDALSGNSAITEPIRIKSAQDMKLTLGIADVRIIKFRWDGFLTINNLTNHTNFEANIRRSGPHIFQQPERRIMIGGRISF